MSGGAPKTAMVLAAGRGTRMRPITNRKPKPLVSVAGHKLIDYTLDRFAAAGVERAIVNVHYLADQVEEHVKERAAPEIIISDERAALLETGGGMKAALPLLGDAPFYCSNTDAILFDADDEEACARLAADWRADDMDALLLLAPIEETSGYDGAGDFHHSDDGAIAFRDGARAPYVFTGLQIISPALVAEGPEGAFSTKILWEKALARGRLFGAVHSGFWMHVGDPEGLKRAEKLMDWRRERKK
ncbi:MAG: nucleotidyltransferase family protein [Pseudomonadota bacterium]